MFCTNKSCPPYTPVCPPVMPRPIEPHISLTIADFLAGCRFILGNTVGDAWFELYPYANCIYSYKYEKDKSFERAEAESQNIYLTSCFLTNLTHLNSIKCFHIRFNAYLSSKPKSKIHVKEGLVSLYKKTGGGIS